MKFRETDASIAISKNRQEKETLRNIPRAALMAENPGTQGVFVIY